MSTDTHRPAPIAETTTPATNPIDEELYRYDEHLRNLRGLSPGTRRGYLRVACQLLRLHVGSGDVDIAKLHPADIRQFLADELEARRTPSHASVLATGLRSCLRYRSTCGDSVGALTAVISSPAHWTLATLPQTLTVEEVEQLLNSFGEHVGWDGFPGALFIRSLYNLPWSLLGNKAYKVGVRY